MKVYKILIRSDTELYFCYSLSASLSRKEAQRKQREKEKEEKERATLAEYEMKIELERRKKAEADNLIDVLEREERDLIDRLKKAQEMQLQVRSSLL